MLMGRAAMPGIRWQPRTRLGACLKTVAAFLPSIIAASAVAGTAAPGTEAEGGADLPSVVLQRSDCHLTEYRFLHGGHTYALVRTLQNKRVRNLIFIDSRLACAFDEYKYRPRKDQHWPFKDDTASQLYEGAEYWPFLWDTERWTDPRYQWEWAAEADGLAYLAAKLRESCGLQPPSLVRPLTRPWSTESATKAEAVAANRAAGPRSPGGYYQPGLLFPFGEAGWINGDPAEMSAEEKRLRATAEICIWSVRLGGTQAAPIEHVGGHDAEFQWPDSRTTVRAYQLGTAYPCYVGLVDGRAVWARGNYPGLRRQSERAIDASGQRD
jgi:hypothetical protein